MDYYIFNWILESRMHHLVKRNGNPVLQDDFVCSMIPPNLSSFNAKYDKTTNKPGHFRQLPFVRPRSGQPSERTRIARGPSAAGSPFCRKVLACALVQYYIIKLLVASCY